MKNNQLSQDKKFIAMNSVRASGPSGISVDTNILLHGGKKDEEQFYAEHGDEKKAGGVLSRIQAYLKR